MPVYEFDCQECRTPFEQLVRTAAAVTDVRCPRCGSGNVERTLSRFAPRMAGGFSGAGAASCAPGGG
jgi:putative FmdB family regulatory protein